MPFDFLSLESIIVNKPKGIDQGVSPRVKGMAQGESATISES
jgi:hypothetical protein